MSNENAQKVDISGETGKPGREEDAFTPLVDIYEEADGTTVLIAEVPGARPDSVDVRVDKGVLTISADGSRDLPGETYTRTYAGFVNGPYYRSFALSDEVDRDSIEANLSEGQLTVRLPRAPEARTHKIEIK